MVVTFELDDEGDYTIDRDGVYYGLICPHNVFGKFAIVIDGRVLEPPYVSLEAAKKAAEHYAAYGLETTQWA